MFTGIITDIGEVIAVDGNDSLRRIRISTRYTPESIAIGASIACAGVCLTVIRTGNTEMRKTEIGNTNQAQGGWFDVEAAAETLRITHVGAWHVGTRINLERAMQIGDELGGHIVTGHVDGLATINICDEVTPSSENWGATKRFTLVVPKPLHRFIAQKGSVTLDGVSLTVNTVADDTLSVLLIPHTLKETTFGLRKAGERVHLEVDLMARYAARLAETA